MKVCCFVAVASLICLTPETPVAAQARGTAPQAAATDVYHVHFAKAVPGQAAALAADLQKQDPKAPMPGHLVLLRHQEGDDWDYCVIEHLGTKATVEVTPPPAASAPALSAWHNDTFVAGPSWAAFQRALGSTATGVYIVSTHRAVPGHRDQLLKVLNQTDPASKVQIGRVTLTHLEGGPWQYLGIDRYNSWQDLAADRASSGTTGTWAEVRTHSAFHTDTIADRVK
jgi:hypothetical protein